MKIKWILFKHNLLTSFFAVKNIYGYWRKNRLLPLALIIGVGNQEELGWWRKEVEKLNIKRKKIDKK